MATSSTVAAVKTALVAQLTALIGDTDVQVAYGRPQDSLVSREAVHVADVAYSAELANMRAGRKHYDEDYTVDVVIAVARPRGEASDAESRAFALFEYLRDLLADADGSSGLGVDGVWQTTLESVDAQVTHPPGADGPVAVIVATVRCRGRVE